MMMDIESFEQERGRRPGTISTLVNTALGEHADEVATAHLDLVTASDLLRGQGHELVCRFGHVHATMGTQEWHLCQIADLASMDTSRFLACLDEAIKQSVEHVLSLSLHT